MSATELLEAQQEDALIAEAETLKIEIDDSLLAFASAEARAEWEALRERWSPQNYASERKKSEPELPITIAKAQRFRSILRQIRERLHPQSQRP